MRSSGLPNKACTRRWGFCAIYKHFFWLRVFPTSQTLSTPAHTRVTQTVGLPIKESEIFLPMKQFKINELGSYTDYLKISVICNLAFAIPCFIILLAIKSVEPFLALLFLAISLFIKCPVVSAFAWLIRGADKANKSLSFKVVGGIPGMFFGFLFGAFLTSSLSSQPVKIISVLFFFLLGTISGIALGMKVGKRMLLEG